MKQINNGFKDYYYLSEDGQVYSKKTKQFLKARYNYDYCLVTVDGNSKNISKKKLYKLVYNANLCEDNIENLENEEWRIIPQTDGKYQVSNKGRIKSFCGYETQLIMPVDRNQKYERVDIRLEDGQKSRQLVHRLVALCFLYDKDTLGKQLHHIDGNPKNNCADNLVWVTPKQHKELHRKMRKESK